MQVVAMQVCGENTTFNQQRFKDFDYEKFTQSPLSTSPQKLKLLAPDSRITSKEYKERVVSGELHVLVDVRPEHHYKIVSLPNSLNIPLTSLEARLPEISSALKEQEEGSGSGANLYVICRRGNDSQRAVECLRNMGFDLAKDIVGGLESWATDVDPNFPMY
ncbi:Adenylyltransferase and sulfurtransferase MOCS3 [Hibiscus syriacus]|uniref:Adenylyltransferase and sulfurtransferase MOCS3 n=1 Tax=Hibiscus syriacus TaxID=106335 RepID=A0A6A3D048_HIBSY|nr:Adenylyltransferase and sulfurtransferase MOCS3 [Hibiscus syriacus]